MKNKILKRFLSVLLFICVFCGSFTLTAFAVVPVWVVVIGNYLIDKAADYSFDKLLDAYNTSATNEYQKNFELKSTFVAYMRDFALSNNLTYDDVLDYLGFLVADWDISFIDTYGENASEVWNTYHSALYKLCYVYYDTDIAALATLITSPEAKAPEVTSDNKVKLPASDFKDYVTETNNKYYPKNTAAKMSYRSDSRWHNHYTSNSDNYLVMTMYDGTCFVPVGGNEMYFVMFYRTDEDTFYGQYQFHVTVTSEDIWFSDRDEVEYTNYSLTLEGWDMLNGSRNEAFERSVFSDVDSCYFDFYPINGSTNAVFIRRASYTDYLDYVSRNLQASVPVSLGFNSFRNSDLSLSTSLSYYYPGSSWHYKGGLSNHDNSCGFDGACDYGYIASTTPIETVYRIDITKIPDNYYVTISGDTVYDYSITNPETGQTSTINEYITNNYTYITNNNGGEGGSGSGSNVTVGGHIDVIGTVGVDINVSVPDINININGGVSGVSSPGQSYDLPNTDIFNSYYDAALDDSSDLRDFLSSFFSFLPPEIILLLGIGLTFVILARIFGR